jgi:uncharacterized protein (DUF983 family)
LFAGVLRIAPRCRACGLDFASFNVGDGPAALLILAIGGIVTALALWFELAIHPAAWVHFLIWPPVALVLVVGTLRITKALLLALEYRHEAREGQRSDPKP